MNSTCAKGNEAIVQETLTHPCFSRIVGFINGEYLLHQCIAHLIQHASAGAFKLFAPDVHAEYARVLDGILDSDESLTRPFSNSVFAAATFNCGRRVTTLPHTDSHNYAPGWCAVMAMGDYDPRIGGHLVLWELKLIIEFPAGSTVFIPSATINHSNIAVQPHERRYSITQYTAGGLARWVACGFKTLKSLAVDGETLAMCGTERWREGVGLLATWGELRRAFGLD